MPEPRKAEQQGPGFFPDWRVTLGFALTLLWFTGGFLYLVHKVGLENFIDLSVADIGNFLEGAFAPLAFLWLVIGHFMQQKEISANTRAIQIQEASALRLELHSQRDAFFKLHHLVVEQLGAIAAFHYVSVCGPAGSGEVSTDDFVSERTQKSETDTEWYIRKMVELAVHHREDQAKMHDIFFGTELRARHSESYTRTFRKLLHAAEAVDTDNMVVDALLNGSSAGILYRIIQHVRGEQLIDSMMGLSNEPGTGYPLSAGEN